MVEKRTFSNRIKNLRTAIPLTQEELAEKLGVTRQTIISMEKGDYVPSLLLAHDIARYFKLPIEEIFIIHQQRK